MPSSLLSLRSFLSGRCIPSTSQLRHSKPAQKPRSEESLKFTPAQTDSIYDAWLASRADIVVSAPHFSAGANRPVTKANLKLAHRIVKLCAPEILKLFWNLHPYRTLIMVCISFVRGMLPIFKGYSHALIINEIQSLITSGHFTWSHLLCLLGSEFLRVVCERLLDSFAADNEHLVQSSARFLVEYQQMEQRVRLDVPTLSDPMVRDLLAESDMFVSSFQGVGGFGLFSPIDFIRILTLLSELVSHIFILSSLKYNSLSALTLVLSVISSAYPFLQTYFAPHRYGFQISAYEEDDARHAEKQEQMRHLSMSESHRPEVMLFGLGPWILATWASARKAGLGMHQPRRARSYSISWFISHLNITELIIALQNIPFVLMLQTSTSLGSLALYRSSVQSIVYAVSNLFITIQMTLQGIFLMGAFCASMEVEPHLRPKKGKTVRYETKGRGMKIEARNLSYTYPGCTEPALRDINFTLEVGETLALVGCNGSGKSTLGKVLLRIVGFDSGELLVNDVDVRRYDPTDLHRASSTVFQGFSKYNGSFTENVGIGFVEDIASPSALKHAIKLAESEHIVDSLPQGIHTRLDALGYDSAIYPPLGQHKGMNAERPTWMPHGLSGGEWQRIALARAFMRAHRPEVDLLLFDEPTSSLDAHAQNKIFDTINSISRSASGEKTKTVVFVTHRLATARRADKIAMMDHGSITEFGTHEELLKLGGSYASLYYASV
ncbi:ABC transporter [Heterobasidion irregulare TC 32-1]|uniref:ABC transporter n=1 Tax=Heterobasidion irregulare (strain TC 32-1) TaxID=747525 RepID=W4KGM6_HETIT|nr:ABC transporter [Heterobasidion irregulare TC 32-1]ETW84465.1 ABC transporter [Heterobasidion irregulare TC 32-1]